VELRVYTKADSSDNRILVIESDWQSVTTAYAWYTIDITNLASYLVVGETYTLQIWGQATYLGGHGYVYINDFVVYEKD